MSHDRSRIVVPGLNRAPVSRRRLLQGAGLGAAALAGSRFHPGLAAPGRFQDAPRFDGETIRVFTMTGPFISGPVRAHADAFTELTGAKIEVIEAPFAELFPKTQQVAATGGDDFDVLLLANLWMPDFVNLEYVVDLQTFIDRDAADSQLAYDDVPDGIKLKNSWGGGAYAWIVDNDNQTMFYRKDILGDPTWQEQYKTETGKDLPNPPQTLTEFAEVAKFFTGKEWGETEGDKYGFITCVQRGQQSYWYAYPWAAPYTVVPKDKAPAQGIFLFDPDMNPLVNTEGFVRGIGEFVQTIKDSMRPGLDTVRADVITDITNGSALMSLDWGDTGPASVADDSVVKDKVGFSLTPGVNEYYDWQTKTWVTVEGDPHRTPTHAYNGWSYYITSQARNPDAAWAWIKFHASPEISAIDVASADSGYQPWRTSHSTNLTAWTDAGWTEGEAKTYIETILAATNDANAVFDVRIPGAARYQEALELQVSRAINDEASAQEAMDEAAKAFNDITEELGKDKQIAAYKSHLGMS